MAIGNPGLTTIGAPGVGTNTESTAATTTNVPFPATVPAGAYCLLMGSSKTAGTTTVTNPAGFTQLIQVSPNANTGAPVCFATRKFATGTEAGTSVTVTHTSVVSIWQILVFTGVDPSTPEDVTPVATDSGGLTGTLPLAGVTTVTPGTTLISLGVLNLSTGNATPPTAPGTFTETADRVAGTAAWEVAYLQNVAKGATGTVTITWSAATARSIGTLIALRPAPNQRIALNNRGALVRASTF